uniref:Biotin-protein ligase N-terminal domain-containing protein n=1 Tax=Desulfovibrio sp. U5L TaxID=596152 RepID=I2PXF1_9BACT
MAAPFLVLWDHSHLWGLLLCRGLAALGAPFAPVSCADVAAGALDRRPPRALLVPGGFARRKFAALGPAGMAAIRGYVARGGAYCGICGGAGLALTHDEGLALCPWTRRAFADRLDHLVSGHVRLAVDPDSGLFPASLAPDLIAPVWWPAGFAPPPAPAEAEVMVVAAYAGAGPDLHLADVHLGAMPEDQLAACRERFGLKLTPAFLDGGACVIAGSFGQGRYVLSHAHLETPDSPQANAWLAHLLAVLGSGDGSGNGFGRHVPAWDPAAEPVRFEDPHLLAARRDLDAAIEAGQAARLLFQRTPWLLGWRPGMPGFSLSNLAGLLAGVAALAPTDTALAYWRGHGPAFATDMAAFTRRLATFFPAQRLEITLSLVEHRPAAAAEPGLAAERRELFGPAPGGGGLCGRLADRLDGLLLRLLG